MYDGSTIDGDAETPAGSVVADDSTTVTSASAPVFDEADDSATAHLDFVIVMLEAFGALHRNLRGAAKRG